MIENERIDYNVVHVTILKTNCVTVHIEIGACGKEDCNMQNITMNKCFDRYIHVALESQFWEPLVHYLSSNFLESLSSNLCDSNPQVNFQEFLESQFMEF